MNITGLRNPRQFFFNNRIRPSLVDNRTRFYNLNHLNFINNPPDNRDDFRVSPPSPFPSSSRTPIIQHTHRPRLKNNKKKRKRSITNFTQIKKAKSNSSFIYSTFR